MSVTPATLPPGVVVRTVTPDDAPAVARLIGELDDQARYRRWFTAGVNLRAVTDWATHPGDHDAIGLVALAGEDVVGHAVLVKRDDGDGEVAFEVAAPWRGQGVASGLLRWLERIARAQGLRGLRASVLAENAPMLAVFREHGGFRERRRETVVEFESPL
jgi:GNAT superfamily N-acetyltransferase